ncbi:MAG: aspartate kinase [Clostridiales bacterium]|jgi:aspartate kinase|nr:aspartate kinase [Clostridiales bacterium]
MSIIVQKYGGSSVADAERIQRVSNHVIELKKQGHQPVVVVSAMGDSTDHLIELAKSVNPSPSSREMDMLLSTGEQISISLLAMAIESKGYQAISLTGYQCGIQTDHFYSKAKINDIKANRIISELEKDNIVIVAGFQGMNENGDITTLGRGGSDTTAVALAVALNAELCEIYTDVKGIYTTDPRVVKTAKQMNQISYDEMLELAKLGAKVMHPRSVELARKNNMKLVVRSSFELSAPGTEIIEVKEMEKAQVRGVTLDDNIVRLSVPDVPDRPGIAYKMFSALAAQNVHIDMIIQNLTHDDRNDISFTVPKDDLTVVQGIINQFIEEVGANPLLVRDDVAKLSIVGTGITSDATIASGLFGALYKMGINIEMISTSEIKISCIIDKARSKEALNEIHEFFELHKVF